MKYGLPAPSPVLVVAAVTAGLAAVTGLVFALWMENGAAIFMTLVETGLAWCY